MYHYQSTLQKELNTHQKSKPMHKSFCSWKCGCTFLVERLYYYTYQPTQQFIGAEPISDKVVLRIGFCEQQTTLSTGILIRDKDIELQLQNKHCDLLRFTRETKCHQEP